MARVKQRPTAARHMCVYIVPTPRQRKLGDTDSIDIGIG